MRALQALLLIAAAASLAACGVSSAGRLDEGEPITVEPLAAFSAPCRTEVAPGDTVESVCRRLAGDDWVLWRDALTTEIDPRRLKPGVVFEGVLSPAEQLTELSVSLDLRSGLALRRSGDAVEVERIEHPVSSVERRVEGSIESSLFAAVDAAGGRPELAVRLAEIFQWDVDFLRDLRKGDHFVVLVEERSVEGAFYDYGTIYAARFVNHGRTLDAIAYPDADGRLGYYDLEGRPLRKQFLRSPLKFSRITSSFSPRRFHPVLKRSMPHYGVDYGAPIGTPVMVTSDGVVSFAGRNGGGGNMVTVRHPNGYETNYLHLNRFAGGVRKGARVSQGQVIGFVGKTGYATGPHLDYRVQLNGRWINPLSISSPPVKPLEAERLHRFLAHAIAVVAVLAGQDTPEGATC